MKFIKQIAQRLNPDLHIPSTDDPPPSSTPTLHKSKSSSTLLLTEKRKTLSTPPSHSSLRKKASSMFLSRGSNVQDFANWGDSPVQSTVDVAPTSAPATRATSPVRPQRPPPVPPLPSTPVRTKSGTYAVFPSYVKSSTAAASTPRPSMQNSTRTTRASTQTSMRTANTQTPMLPPTPEAREPAPIASSMSVRSANKSLSYFPLAGQAKDGFSDAEEATATCFCGAVQLAFPVEGPGLVASFVCNCTDCRKITASMFASNFTIRDTHLRHVRGRSNLSTYSQVATIASGHAMTNHFCQTCGTLMYRVGAAFPDCSILRLGTVDDFNLVETKLKPTRELLVKDRVDWFSGVQGDEVKSLQAML